MARKRGYALALEALEQSAEVLELSAEVRTALRTPEQVRETQVPVRTSDGETRWHAAYRVQHNTWRGPVRGGTLYRTDVALDVVKALAMRMSWTWALFDIPLGGGACGLAVGDPVQAEAGWDGKDELRLSGEAAGRSVYHAVAASCEQLRIPLKQARVAVQGFGAAGSTAAALLAEAGAVVVGAGDSRGAIFRATGLDVGNLVRHKAKSGSVAGFAASEPISDCELLALECDVLVAAALDNAIHCQNAPAIRARIIAEAAQAPLTPGADRVLEGKGVLLLPDLLCNAGAPVASWLARQPREGGLEGAMRQCFQRISAAARERRVGMRQAAWLLAVARVAAARRA